MKDLKAAVIGCGDAARVDHLPWYAMSPDVEIVGVVDPDASKAEYCARRWGGKTYADVGKMLESERPDVVSVCTPVHLHADHTIACAQAGCHVLCEKPMAPTLTDCREMIAAADENKVTLGLGFMRRFNLGYGLARQIVQSGRIGRVLFARGYWIVNKAWDGFRVELATGGGVFQDCGSHLVDLCRWLLDTEYESVQGVIDICRPDLTAVEDQAVAILGMRRGPSCTIEVSWVGPSSHVNEHLEETWIYGADGAVKVDFPSCPYGVAKVEVWDRETGQWTLMPMRPFEKRTFDNCHYKRLVDAFVASVKEGSPFEPSGEDGLKAIEVVLGLYKASHTGGTVALPLDRDPPVSEMLVELRRRKLDCGGEGA